MRHRQKPSRSPDSRQLTALLKESGIELNRTQLDLLWRYHSLLRIRNQDRDLTRLVGFESIVTKHYIDCLYPARFLTPPSPIVDVGSGAGFPGIPLKIRFPHLKVWLAEPRPRRAAFLKEVRANLGLKNVEIFDHKVTSRSFRHPVKAVISRALETIDRTLLRTSGALEPGGLAIFMKGPGVDPEISTAKERLGDTFRLVADHKYRLPHTTYDRRLVIYERTEMPLIGSTDVPEVIAEPE